MKDALKAMKALADPARLRIVSILLRREMCVCELMFVLRMEQSRLSHQLRLLRDAELVEDRREGRWINYRVPNGARRGLERLLADFLGLKPDGPNETATDLSRLKLCLKQDIRRRQGPVPAHRGDQALDRGRKMIRLSRRGA